LKHSICGDIIVGVEARRQTGGDVTSSKVSVRAKTAMPSTSSPVTARGARTRAALVKAARSLFERNGYLETNVGDIARRAGVAHGTFYTYFNSKEEIFSEVVEALQADLARIASDEPNLEDGSIAARIERANRGYIRAYETNARMIAVLEQVATFNPRLAQMRRAVRKFWNQRSSEAIRRWQERGIVDKAIDPDYAASALGAMIDRSAYVWIVLGEPYEFETAVVQLTRLYCNALGVPYHRAD
jgi:AcrR family transcriptional regulator